VKYAGKSSQSLLFYLFSAYEQLLRDVRGTKAKEQRLALPSATPLFSAGITTANKVEEPLVTLASLATDIWNILGSKDALQRRGQG
jgi:hypothetical protein